MAVNTAMLVRPASPADVSALCDVLADLFRIESDFSADPAKQANGLRLLEDESGRSKVFVAVHEGRVIGMCSVQVIISTAECRPAGRNHGRPCREARASGVRLRNRFA